MANLRLETLTKRYGQHTLAVDHLDLTLADGECLALVGPSGCGKTTTLRLIAGLTTPTSGQIHMGQKCVTSWAPAARDIAMVFQQGSLYPHMTARENMDFGLRMRGVERGERQQRIRAAAEQLRIEELLDRFPDEISGGQQQRVALGRAWVRQPKLFLLDEPLAHLDPGMRAAVRAEIGQLWATSPCTTIYVTHDQAEALTLGRRIAVMNRGVLQQVGTPAEIYRHPANTFVATFIGDPGMNLVPGTRWQGAFHDGTSSWPVTPPTQGDNVILGIRPEDLRPASRDSSSIVGTVRWVEHLGHMQCAHLVIGSQTVIVRLPGTATLSVGEQLPLSFGPDACHWFDGASPHQRLDV